MTQQTEALANEICPHHRLTIENGKAESTCIFGGSCPYYGLCSLCPRAQDEQAKPNVRLLKPFGESDQPDKVVEKTIGFIR